MLTSQPLALSALLTGVTGYSARTTPPATARRTSGRRTAGPSRSGTSRAASTRTGRARTAEPSSPRPAPIRSDARTAALAASVLSAASRSGTSALSLAVTQSSARATPPGAALLTATSLSATYAPLTDAGSGSARTTGSATARITGRPRPASLPGSAAAPGCDRTLRTDNTTGYCTDHVEPTWKTPRVPGPEVRQAITRQSRERPDTRRTCSVDGCDRKLRSDNTTGRCNDHRLRPA